MERSSNPSHLQHVPSIGLTTLLDPKEAVIDIVFVHGFTGHPERTWTHKNGDPLPRVQNEDQSPEPPAKIRKTSIFSKTHNEGPRQPIYWPRDLLPSTVPNARVLTYGYDTHIRHKFGGLPATEDTVYDLAGDFLVALEAKRRPEPLRPVLFVVHSLGGIIVKEMLRKSRGYTQAQQQLRSVFNGTTGIIFFGTPHGGADPRGFLLHLAESVLKLAGLSVNENIANALLPSAERLRELRDEFGPMAREQKWSIHSFQEQYGVRILGDRKVVDDPSSYLNFPAVEITEHIARNHMEMCRFTGLNDTEYIKVACAIQRIVSSVFEQSIAEVGPSLTDAQKKLLLESLRFDQIDARQMTIKNAHAKTCKWLLVTREFLEWLSPAKVHDHHGFLWIKGKPGTGKSTLMKFALAHAKRKMKSKTVLSFFFNARGESIEQSTFGLYRSILLQLLERHQSLQSIFDSLGLSPGAITANYQWSIEFLKTLLEQAIGSLGSSSVVCFIDALDECDESQIRDMLSFFEHVCELAIADGINFQVCFSSRHYPHITIKKGLSLILEGHEGHNQDMANFLDSELKVGSSKVAGQIRDEIKDKASGIFMWVVLVVGILNKEYDSGRIHALRRRLQEIPSDLHELFRDILMRDFHNRAELVLCLQWVLFAKRPLKPEELYFAIISGVDPEGLTKWDPDEIDSADISRFILSSSKGLIEITTSKVPKVQFIHESVNDFLLKESGLGKIWSDLGSNFHGQSHEQLKLCCNNYMKVNLASDLIHKVDTILDMTIYRDAMRKDFPFMEYAVKHILQHANTAGSCNITQEQFLQSFDLLKWIRLNNVFEPFYIRKYFGDTSLLYVLAEHDASHLLKYISSPVSSFLEVGNERYGTPLLAAVVARSYDVLREFLEIFRAELQPGSELYELCNPDSQARKSITELSRNFQFSSRRNILLHLAEYGDAALFAAVLSTHLSEVNSTDSHSRSPLSLAAKGGHKEIVKLLLETGQVELDCKDDEGRTPLSWAAYSGRVALVKLLLETGDVEVESKDYEGGTPLFWAVKWNRMATVKLLLDTGKANVNAKDFSGDTPLTLAHKHENKAMLKLLCEASELNVISTLENDSGTTTAAYEK